MNSKLYSPLSEPPKDEGDESCGGDAGDEGGDGDVGGEGNEGWRNGGHPHSCLANGGRAPRRPRP